MESVSAWCHASVADDPRRLRALYADTLRCVVQLTNAELRRRNITRPAHLGFGGRTWTTETREALAKLALTEITVRAPYVLQVDGSHRSARVRGVVQQAFTVEQQRHDRLGYRVYLHVREGLTQGVAAGAVVAEAPLARRAVVRWPAIDPAVPLAADLIRPGTAAWITCLRAMHKLSDRAPRLFCAQLGPLGEAGNTRCECLTIVEAVKADTRAVHAATDAEIVDAPAHPMEHVEAGERADAWRAICAAMPAAIDGEFTSAVRARLHIVWAARLDAFQRDEPCSQAELARTLDVARSTINADFARLDRLIVALGVAHVEQRPKAGIKSR